MNHRRAGYSLIELLIAATVLSVIMGAGIIAMRATQRSFQETVSTGVLNQRTNRALNRIARAITAAGQSTVIVSAQSDVISFQNVVGFAGSSPIWSNNTELRLQYEPGELDNGIDDDGDGFIDECQVLLTEDLGQPAERSVVLARSVREFLEGEVPDGADNNGNLLDDERGLCFELQGSTLMIRLTLLRRLPEGGVGLQSLFTSVGFRN